MKNVCKICNSSEINKVFKIRESYVYMCNNCKFSFCFPLPSANYKSSGDHSVATAETCTRSMLTMTDKEKKICNALATERYKFYSSLVRKKEFKLLEIGCGVAAMADQLELLGVNYYGIDIDNRVVNMAKSRVKNIRNIDFMSLDNNEKYDVIFFSQVLEHIIEPVVFIEKVYNQLNLGGVVQCDLPNDDCLSGYIHKIINIDKNRFGGILYPNHLFSYKKKTLEFLLAKYFSNVKYFSVNCDNKIWGRAHMHSISLIERIFFKIAIILNRESILVCIAQKIHPN